MRVLLINDYHPEQGPVVGGCEIVVRTLADALGELGVQTELFTAADVPGGRSPLNYVWNGRARRALSDKLDDFGADVVHFHNIYHRLSPSVLDALHGRAAVATAHDGHLACPNPTLRSFDRGGETRIEPGCVGKSNSQLLRTRWDSRGRFYSTLRAAQWIRGYRLERVQKNLRVVMCPSRFLTELLRAEGLPVEFMPPPVIDPGAIAGTSHGRDVPRLVFAGRIEPEKGLAAMLERIATDRPWELHVAGSGADEQRCRAVAEMRGIENRITWLGRLSHAATRELIASGSGLIAVSRCPENAPAAVLEAVRAGTPVLTSDLGGVGEIIHDCGGGVAVDPFDAKAVSEGFGMLLDGRIERGETEAYFAERTPRVHALRVIAAYERALAGEPLCVS